MFIVLEEKDKITMPNYILKCPYCYQEEIIKSIDANRILNSEKLLCPRCKKEFKLESKDVCMLL